MNQRLGSPVDPRSPHKGWAPRLAGAAVLAAFLVGVFVALTLPFEIAQKLRAERWPARAAVITRSFVGHAGGVAGTADYSRPEICGVYRDSGEPFCVRHVRFGSFRWGGGEAQAREAVARYPVGREVLVFHAPDDPRETVLEPHSSWREIGMLAGLGLVGLALPPLLWWLGRRRVTPPA
jgi:hypothetical protein